MLSTMVVLLSVVCAAAAARHLGNGSTHDLVRQVFRGYVTDLIPQCREKVLVKVDMSLRGILDVVGTPTATICFSKACIHNSGGKTKCQQTTHCIHTNDSYGDMYINH